MKKYAMKTLDNPKHGLYNERNFKVSGNTKTKGKITMTNNREMMNMGMMMCMMCMRISSVRVSRE